MATVVYAPGYIPDDERLNTRLFLAGSIEMGSARDWQQEYCDMFQDLDELVILNPRRPDWDSSWEQSIDNKQFRTQVEWELNNIRHADIVAMYLDPNTKAPISLLELGVLTSLNLDVVVYCPKGFWRKGNVDVVCKMYGIKVYEDENDFKVALASVVKGLI